METQLELAGGAGPFARGARYNGYGAFLRERFGCRVYKVIVDAGFTCPNRDGTVAIGGCTYCNNDSFRPQAVNRLKPIPEQVRTGITYLKRRYRAQKFVVYFQPFTNTYAPLETLIPLYESSLDHPEVIGLAVGTRPDCVNAEKICWFERLARQYGIPNVYGSQFRRVKLDGEFDVRRGLLGKATRVVVAAGSWSRGTAAFDFSGAE